MKKYPIVRIEVIKGFATGRVCRALQIVEDGRTIYRCFPDNSFYIDYPTDFVKVIR